MNITDFASIVSWIGLQISKIFVNLHSHFVGQCILFLIGLSFVSGIFISLWKKDRE